MFESRKELFSKIEGLEMANSQLVADLAAAQSKLDAQSSSDQDTAALKEDLEAATEENKTLSAKLESAEQKTTPAAIVAVAVDAISGKNESLPDAEKQQLESAIAVRVTAEMAAAGHPPLDLTEHKQEDKKEDFSNLSGLDKAIAIHKSQQK